MAEETDDLATVIELIGRGKSAMLTTMTPEGDHVSRPMGVQEAEFDGDLWFFTYEDSNKVRQIRENPKVNVSISNDAKAEWTSIAGTAEIVKDRAKAEELWSKPLEAWFPDGLETPGLVLVRVHGDSAEYWDGPSTGIARLIGLGVAFVKKDPDAFPAKGGSVDL